ncbi:MAG: O-antigen ligase family protein [Verrucomicrobia bacterium]|jgi:O-antigen ligase|nr:O-antigen ligase family protein [Verrucomicrobiota bacterium]
MRKTHPRVMAYLGFLLTIPLGEVSVAPGFAWLTVTKVSFLLLLGVLAYSWIRGWRPVMPTRSVLVSMGLLVFGVCLSALCCGERGASLSYAIRIVALCMLCLATVSLSKEPGFLVKALGALAIAAFLCALLGIYQTSTGETLASLGQYGYFGRMIELCQAVEPGGVSVVRASAAFDHPNVLGTFLIGILPAALFFMLHRGSHQSRILSGGAAIAIIIALVYTFSRSAWLGGLVGVSLVVLPLRWSWSRIAGVVVGGLVLAVILLPPEAKQVLLNRTGTAQPYDSGRLYSWHTAGSMIAAHPLLGVGPGMFHHRYAAYADKSEVYKQNPLHHMDAHNTFLDLAAEGGLPVCLAFVALMVAALIHLVGAADLWQARGPTISLGIPLLAGCVAILSQSLLQSLQYEEIWWVLLALGLSLPAKQA